MSASTSPPDLPIAGVIPFSATDWPGQLTITVFTQGCPLRCPYCHNPTLQAVGPGLAWDSSLLERRRGLIDAIVISGGEPTMHSSLGAFIAWVHSLGFPVGLHTSGYRPSAIAALLAAPSTTPDWVGLDVKGFPEDCEALFGMSPRAARGCWSSLELLSDAGVPLQVRTTVWPAFTDHLPALKAKVGSYGHQLVVQQARGVDAEGHFRAS
ncbi:pyrroloquinoline quinone biosynthesis protein PqqE [Corynebacterium kalinowskii]|uniref:Pyrroloquinoline quinone biosynthesis protein PqqE n=1 Tax=Corynebacterium kalinowskii TaxID=2675216 RepID=A0A6B8VR16_9CORY|nr:anaerobic ribonucleoside-triphosphate reductase activating protein [Corynebacterium kalinowskii]QGU01206.1 pyrroloquinoline quinone biosynthesis protein PqqE [Corynebacterium kalinowskii]